MEWLSELIRRVDDKVDQNLLTVTSFRDLERGNMRTETKPTSEMTSEELKKYYEYVILRYNINTSKYIELKILSNSLGQNVP